MEEQLLREILAELKQANAHLGELQTHLVDGPREMGGQFMGHMKKTFMQMVWDSQHRPPPAQSRTEPTTTSTPPTTEYELGQA